MTQRRTRLEELLTRFHILLFRRRETIEAAVILGHLFRKGQPIEYRDALIAGIVRANGVTQISRAIPSILNASRAFKRVLMSSGRPKAHFIWISFRAH